MYKSLMTIAAAMLVSSVAMAQTSTPSRSSSQAPGSGTPPAAQKSEDCAKIIDASQRTACMNRSQSSGATGTGSGSMSTGSPPASGSGSMGSGSTGSGSGSMNRSPSGSSPSGSGTSGSGSGTTR